MIHSDDDKIQEQDLSSLENRVEDLVRACKRLKEENETLKNVTEQLSIEKEQLMKTNAFAYSRVESMVNKLKTLELEL
tara:strand:+ start:228 stop:461 length:234 start_codon:yes stop_codon:yes gene_type:complete